MSETVWVLDPKEIGMTFLKVTTTLLQSITPLLQDRAIGNGVTSAGACFAGDSSLGPCQAEEQHTILRLKAFYIFILKFTT